MNQLLIDGLLDVFDRILTRCRPEIDNAIEWLREGATPPENLEFRASDGAVYTGLIVLERSRAVLMLAIRSQVPASNPLPQPTPAYQPRYDPPRYDPARRDLFHDEPGDGWPADPFGRR